VLWAILFINAAVAGARIAYGLAVDSLAIYGDGLHAATDGLNNVVGLAILRLAHRPADSDHPYGHQRYEVLASAAIGLVLLGLAGELFNRAINAFDHQLAAPDVAMGGWVLLGGTLVINVGVATWERRMGRKLRSALLVADADHTAGDILTTLGVIASTFFAARGMAFLDVLAAVLLGTIIGFAGLKLLYASAQTLADRRALPPAKIRELALQVPGVVDVDHVRSRGGPGAVHVDLVVRLPGDLSFEEAHAISDRVEAQLVAAIDDIVDVVVHAEPAEPAAPDAARPPSPDGSDKAPSSAVSPSPPRAVA
jgi:cation diffusion facilitator family transporter